MARSAIKLIVISTLSIGLRAENLYNVNDLEVLEKEKNYEEFIAHAYDVRPSKRDKHWKEMYESVAIALLEIKIKNKEYTPITYKLLKSILDSQPLKNDELYRIKFEQYGRKFFRQCYINKGFPKSNDVTTNPTFNCDIELQSFWNNSKKDAENAIELAQIVSEGKSLLNPWIFYKTVVKDDLSNFYCQKPEIQKSIIITLNEETFKKEFNGNYKKLLTEKINDKCIEQLVPTLKNISLLTESTPIEKELALNLLDSIGQITPSEKDLFSVVYLLNGPVVGERLNLNWKNIESLFENFSRREKLLNEMKKMPHLPDKIFSDPTLPRNKAIISLFAKNFPEYLNYYAESCIKYLNYSNEDINIRSAYECRQFLRIGSNSDQDISWFNDSIKVEYSALKK